MYIEIVSPLSAKWIIPVRVIKVGKLARPIRKPLGLDVDMDDHTDDWYNDERDLNSDREAFDVN